ncbi:MAG TPA: porin family protein [Gemmatimonadales bacterium]|nr:porin family protein [Gemmatimonadales bacterium]
MTVDGLRSTVYGLLVLVLAGVSPLRAQVLIGYLFGEKLAGPNFNMGFEVGVNFATLDGMGDADRARKTVFGLFADWRFSEHFHLGTAVLPFAGRGAKNLEPVPTGDPEIDGQTAGGTMSRSMSYVEIPVILKWSPKRQTGFRVGAGPSLGIITGAHDRYDATTSAGTPYLLERDVESQVTSVDAGLSAEVEWRFPVLSIAARYTHGLTAIAHLEGSPIRTRVLTGTGRIYLGKKKPSPPAAP